MVGEVKSSSEVLVIDLLRDVQETPPATSEQADLAVQTCISSHLPILLRGTSSRVTLVSDYTSSRGTLNKAHVLKTIYSDASV